MKRLWQNYSLGIVLGTLFILSWIAQLYTQWQEFVIEQASQNQDAIWSDFWWYFLSATFENWQSEFLQLLTFVVAAKIFIFRDSPQSRDGDDKMQSDLDAIKRHLGVE